MNQQLQYITNTRAQIVELVGENQTEAIFANALFIVNMGSNDYDNNYLLTGSTTSIKYNPQQFQDLLISTYAQQLTTLYNLGGRKFMVCGVGPLGCIPSQIVQNSLNQNGQCVEFINAYVQGFNAALRPMLQQLTATLPGATFTYANSYDLGMSYINNPGTYGV
jgi:phospholipase/lecithinase/hemolysin